MIEKKRAAFLAIFPQKGTANAREKQDIVVFLGKRSAFRRIMAGGTRQEPTGYCKIVTKGPKRLPDFGEKTRKGVYFAEEDGKTAGKQAIFGEGKPRAKFETKNFCVGVLTKVLRKYYNGTVPKGRRRDSCPPRERTYWSCALGADGETGAAAQYVAEL